MRYRIPAGTRFALLNQRQKGFCALAHECAYIRPFIFIQTANGVLTFSVNNFFDSDNSFVRFFSESCDSFPAVFALRIVTLCKLALKRSLTLVAKTFQAARQKIMVHSGNLFVFRVQPADRLDNDSGFAERNDNRIVFGTRPFPQAGRVSSASLRSFATGRQRQYPSGTRP